MKIGNYEIQVPFVTTSTDTVKDLVALLGKPTNERVADLGSGDGRVVLELAKVGYTTYGFEIKNDLVERAKKRIIDQNLQQKAFVSNKDFWLEDVSRFDIIYIYGMQSIMGRLEEKLEKELKPGTKVILNVFHLPHWKPKKTKNYLTLYIKP